MSTFPLDQSSEQTSVNEYRAALRQVGLRATYARLQIARFLAQTSGPVTIGGVIRGVGSDSCGALQAAWAFPQAER